VICANENISDSNSDARPVTSTASSREKPTYLPVQAPHGDLLAEFPYLGPPH
jgi:hypothetical protein